MKDETKAWLFYADENLKSAKILLESHLYNPSLQNSQQAIEKFLKACFIEKGIKLQKTHTIAILVEKVRELGLHFMINDDEIDLIDSIYLASKYPFGSVLPDFEPDENVCQKCIDIAVGMKNDIESCLKEER